MLGAHAFRVVILKKLSQSFVAKAFNDCAQINLFFQL